MSTVSVIVPTYNRSYCLRKCLDSILQQSFSDFELIVVDDGSEDDTPLLLESYREKATIVYQKNQGVSCARNTGIALAKGIYLAFCDSDDLWVPQKLQKQMEFFQKHPESMVCYTDEIWIRNGKRVNPCKHHEKVSGWIFEKSLELCLVSPSSVMMHRCFFEQAGNFDETLPACEDYDLWLRASQIFPFSFIPEYLIVKYGGHPDQLSHKHWGMDRFRIQAILKCLNSPTITQENKEKAILALKKKCTILANGAEKRGNYDLSKQCREWIEKYI
mgnify:CR=1 FL=1